MSLRNLTRTFELGLRRTCLFPLLSAFTMVLRASARMLFLIFIGFINFQIIKIRLKKVYKSTSSLVLFCLQVIKVVFRLLSLCTRVFLTLLMILFLVVRVRAAVAVLVLVSSLLLSHHVCHVKVSHRILLWVLLFFFRVIEIVPVDFDVFSLLVILGQRFPELWLNFL